MCRPLSCYRRRPSMDLVGPQALRQTTTFAGNICRQFINARHLPLVFTAQTQHLQKPRAARRNRYDYTQLSAFYNHVETSLLSMTNNEFPPAKSTGPGILAYTDGSCPNNQIVSDPLRLYHPTSPYGRNLAPSMGAGQNQPH